MWGGILNAPVGEDLVAQQHAVCTDGSLRPAGEASMFAATETTEGTALNRYVGGTHRDDVGFLTLHREECLIPTFAAKRDGRTDDNILSILRRSTAPNTRGALQPHPAPERLHTGLQA